MPYNRKEKRNGQLTSERLIEKKRLQHVSQRTQYRLSLYMEATSMRRKKNDKNNYRKKAKTLATVHEKKCRSKRLSKYKDSILFFFHLVYSTKEPISDGRRCFLRAPSLKGERRRPWSSVRRWRGAEPRRPANSDSSRSRSLSTTRKYCGGGLEKSENWYLFR